jgi:hypothetical protein
VTIPNLRRSKRLKRKVISNPLSLRRIARRERKKRNKKKRRSLRKRSS